MTSPRALEQYSAAQWCRADLGWGYGDALQAVLVASLLGGLWLRLLGGSLAPGAPRLLASLPLLAANAVTSKLFCPGEDATTVVLVCFNTLWLSSFKALAWVLNRGPLADARLTASQFVTVYLAPLTPKHDASGSGGRKGRLGEHAGGVQELLRAWLAKFLIIGGGTLLWTSWTSMPGVLRSLLFSFGLFGLLSAIMDGPAAAITGLLGLELSPHFDTPWLAHSVANFWNARWDLAAGNTLRTLIFDPIVDGRLVHDPKVVPALNSRWRQLAGTFASFATSGLIHEAIYWYMTGRTTGGVWLAYFSIQAPIIVAERVVLGTLKRSGVSVPAALRILATVGLQILLGHWLFWPPVVGEVAEHVLGNIRATANSSYQAAAAALRTLQ